MKLPFLENVKRMGIANFSPEGLTADQAILRNAVKSFIDSDEERSEKLLRELLSIPGNDELKDFAVDLLFALLVWQDRFAELDSLGLPRNAEDAEQVEMYDTQDTEFIFSSEFEVVDMPDFPWIQPLMTVRINGKSRNLLIDTGALATIVTQSVAEQCGLMQEETTIEVAAATEGSVTMQTARITELELGPCIIKNKRCMIAPDEAFDFSVVGGPKIDGIIGWEIIKRLYWEIDFQNRTVGVRAATQEDVGRNMCCDFFPMVKMGINGSETIVAGFDTGAVVSNFGKSMVGRFPGAEVSEREMMGVGQSAPSNYPGYEISELPIEIGGTHITLHEVFVLAESEYSKGRTLVQAGALGCDAALDRVLVIDYQNRHLSIK